MKIHVFMLIVVLLLFVGGCISQNQDIIKAKKIMDYDQHKYDNTPATGTMVDGVRVIHLKASQFAFDPVLIIVNKGEKIKLIIEAIDVPHGFEIEGYDIPGYDINTVIRKGIPLEITFMADHEGVWEFLCTIYCGYGHSHMSGVFVIR